MSASHPRSDSPTPDLVLPPGAAEFVERVAPIRRPVGLEGETGVGKNHLAKLIHQASGRRGSFLTANVTALTEDLFESEVFGHERGAFTGAHETTRGLIESADGGTLVLDELGRMRLSHQAKLLTFLDTGEVRRVGSTKPVEVDTRVIWTTNLDLRRLVHRGDFLPDLFFRVRGPILRIPPLRERRDQLLDIARVLLVEIAAELGAPPIDIAPRARERLHDYHWPGNIRQLQNVLSGAALAAADGVIEAPDLPSLEEFAFDSLSEFGGGRRAVQSEKHHPYVAPSDPTEERDMIEEALAAESGIVKRSAQRLGMSRGTLYGRIRRYRIRLEDYRQEG
ncbi:MAG: sigma 54-interacting transcriptional regulator [Longimicrobiales bacterium]|nr:sigma 54-interacting transcriptional regulator [Longimicrobiales bacterium]